MTQKTKNTIAGLLATASILAIAGIGGETIWTFLACLPLYLLALGAGLYLRKHLTD